MNNKAKILFALRGSTLVKMLSRYDEDGNEVQQPKELCDTVLKNMYDVDCIHQAIMDAIEQEIDWKTEGVSQMSQNF